MLVKNARTVIVSAKAAAMRVRSLSNSTRAWSLCIQSTGDTPCCVLLGVFFGDTYSLSRIISPDRSRRMGCNV